MKLAARNMTQMERIRRLTSPDQLPPGQYNTGNMGILELVFFRHDFDFNLSIVPIINLNLNRTLW